VAACSVILLGVARCRTLVYRMAVMFDVEPATPEDRAAIRALLDANELPVQDLAESGATFLVARVDGVLAGVVGLEALGTSALLRSLCVASERRKQGLARSLCAAIEALARGHGVRELYLLTTTARPFFERQGFAVGTRDTAPAEIRATAEFRDLCPSTASLMRKPLPPTAAP
jgi:amino-acid N-acetyltransferase